MKLLKFFNSEKDHFSEKNNFQISKKLLFFKVVLFGVKEFQELHDDLNILWFLVQKIANLKKS